MKSSFFKLFLISITMIIACTIIWYNACYNGDDPITGVLGQHLTLDPTPTPTPTDLAVVTIVTDYLPYGELGRTYFVPLRAAGGNEDYTWSVAEAAALESTFNMEFTEDGILKTITIDEEAKTLATLENRGTIELNITCTDSNATQTSDTKTFTLIVSDIKVVIYSTSLNDGVEGEYYKTIVNAWGGTRPYNWEDTSGTLASLGLEIDAIYGEISPITPDAPLAAGTAGEHIITLKVSSDPTNPPQTSDTRTFLLTIHPAGTLTLSAYDEGDAKYTGSTITSIQVDNNFDGKASIVARNGSGNHFWRQLSGYLADGLNIYEDPLASGRLVIVGTPEEAGVFYIEYEVADLNTDSTASCIFSHYIQAIPLNITSSTLNIYIEQENTQSVDYEGGLPPMTFSYGNMTVVGHPEITVSSLDQLGLTFDTGNGVFTGTPSKSLFTGGGIFDGLVVPVVIEIEISAEDFFWDPATDEEIIYLAIQPQPINITNNNALAIEIPLGYEVPDVDFNVEGGIGKYTWSMQCLPVTSTCEQDYNLTINSSTGEVLAYGNEIVGGIGDLKTITGISEGSYGRYRVVLSEDLSSVTKGMRIIISGTKNFNGNFPIVNVNAGTSTVTIASVSGFADETTGSAIITDNISKYYLSDYRLASISATVDDNSLDADLVTAPANKSFNITVLETSVEINNDLPEVMNTGKERVVYPSGTKVYEYKDFCSTSDSTPPCDGTNHNEIVSITEIDDGGLTGNYTILTDPAYVDTLTNATDTMYLQIVGLVNFTGTFKILAVRPGAHEIDIEIGTSGLTTTYNSDDGIAVISTSGYSIPIAGGVVPYKCTTADPLPEGLTLFEDDCKILGLPMSSDEVIGGTTGGYNIEIQVQDLVPVNGDITANPARNHTDTEDFTLYIVGADLEITTASAPSITIGQPFGTYTLQAAGGVPPYHWTYTSVEGQTIDSHVYAFDITDYGLEVITEIDDVDTDSLIIQMPEAMTRVDPVYIIGGSGIPINSITRGTGTATANLSSAPAGALLGMTILITGTTNYNGYYTISAIAGNAVTFIFNLLVPNAGAAGAARVIQSTNNGYNPNYLGFRWEITDEAIPPHTITSQDIDTDHVVLVNASLPNVSVGPSDNEIIANGEDFDIQYSASGGLGPYQPMTIEQVTEVQGIGTDFYNEGVDPPCGDYGALDDGKAVVCGTISSANSFTYYVRGTDSMGVQSPIPLSAKTTVFVTNADFTATNGSTIHIRETTGSSHNVIDLIDWRDWGEWGDWSDCDEDYPFPAWTTAEGAPEYKFNWYWGESTGGGISKTHGTSNWRLLQTAYIYLEAGVYRFEINYNASARLMINSTVIFSNCTDAHAGVTSAGNYTAASDGWYLIQNWLTKQDDPDILDGGCVVGVGDPAGCMEWTFFTAYVCKDGAPCTVRENYNFGSKIISRENH